MRNLGRFISAIAVGGLLTGVASASPWNSGEYAGALGPSGTASFFSWENGTNQTDLFGSPSLGGPSSFTFSPDSFEVSSVNGAADDNATDQASVTLRRLPGFFFDQIVVTETGTWSTDLPGDAVTVSGSVQILDLINAEPPFFLFPREEQYGFGSNVTFNPDGTWSLQRVIDLTGFSPVWEEMNFTLSNNLQASSVAGSAGALIAKTGVTITFTPEPASMLGLVLLLPLGLRRR